MREKILVALLALASITGCSDYKLSTVPVYEPNITATPEEHDFGALHSGYETGEVDVIVTNTGNDDLLIDDVYLMGPSDIAFSPTLPSIMEPGQQEIITITYTPETFQVDSARLYIFSNDPDTEVVEIPLLGQGDAPVIEITPDYHDFTTVFLGCDDEIEVSIGNVGNANLEVSDVEYFASIPVDFSLEDYEDAIGSLPWTIAPNDSINLTVGYTPLDLLDDDGLLIITADHGNDPTYKGTDHTREYIPILCYGKTVNPGADFGTRSSFADIGATIADLLGVESPEFGQSFSSQILTTISN